MKTALVRVLTIMMIVPLFMVLMGVSVLNAQNTMKVGGEGNYVIIDRPMFEFDDTEGHFIYAGKWEGMNHSVGDTDFFDGAVVHFVSYGDYVKGNGPFWGYLKMMKDGDTVYSKFEGEAKSNISGDGTPVMLLSGSMKMLRGTGRYEGIQGSANFSNRMLSDRMMVSEWNGEYSIKN